MTEKEVLSQKITNVLIFGDSIGYGQWDEKGGWVQRFRAEMDQRLFHQKPETHYKVYNLSVTGETTDKMLKRFESEVRARIKNTGEAIIIFNAGVNDSAFSTSKDGFQVNPENFEKNIIKLLEQTSKIATRVVFVGPTPVDEEKTIPLSHEPDLSLSNEQIRKYNEIIKNVCLSNKITFIDLLEDLETFNTDEFLFDGLHPNSTGHELILNKVINGLLTNEIITL